MSVQYNKAIIRAILFGDSKSERDYFEKLALQCNELTLAIPDRWMYARIFGSDYGYNPEQIRDVWMDYKWIKKIVILDRDHMKLPMIKELADFDTVFYGTEYGDEFQNDLNYSIENGLIMVSQIPSDYSDFSRPNALEFALKDVPYTKKIVLFGTGNYFEKYMRDFGEKYKPSYAVDNNAEKWNSEKNGIEIYNPEKLFDENPQDVLVVICSKNYMEQRRQLLSRGKFNYRVLRFNNNFGLLEEFLLAAEHEKSYMQEATNILHKLMYEFDRVCRKYGLKYYIISGSLIGVVRHHGLIPWDDDIDVGMPRTEFEKLKKIAKDEWKGEEFLFLNYDELGNDTFHDLMPRLYYMKKELPTRIMDKSREKMVANVADKLILDIYPMDNASDNCKRHEFNMLRIKFLYNLLMGHRGQMNYDEYAKLQKKQVDLIKFVNCIGRKISFKWLIKCMERVIQCENKHDTQCYFMSSGPIYFVERVYQKSFFEEGIEMNFDDIKVTVPKNYDGLLHSQMYGNYMEYPPYAVRKPSHYFNADISIW